MNTLTLIFQMLIASILLDSSVLALQNYSQTQRNKEVVRKYFEVLINEQKIELLEELFHQGRVNINWDTGEGEEGLNNLKTFLFYFFNAFPDLTCSVEEIIGESNKVMVKINYRGTHKGEFLGFSPSNNSINVSNAYLFYLESGKISSSSSLINFKTLESQLETI